MYKYIFLIKNEGDSVLWLNNNAKIRWSGSFSVADWIFALRLQGKNKPKK